ncbi:hypothetical protein [Bacillus thuringiensis]|uniref:hypothetical protein n=1 Tax=Bacillus thuringiensis TaxID=1428 RepID=UPI000BFB8C7F|nr:hypothetical protein [Bacillus thuringiensis]PGM47422.1 hypothetical protein CN937_03885 [Bacillus thuringiensis]
MKYKVEILRASRMCGEASKVPPTKMLPLEEVKYSTRAFNKDSHDESRWFTETDDLGKLIVELQAYEKEEIIFGGENNYSITKYDGYVE